MSDDERMDRAERIRQLRQGRRGGESEDGPDDANRSSSTEQADDGTAKAVDGEQPEPDSTTNDEESSADETDPEASATASDGTDGATPKASTPEDDVSTDTGDESEGSALSDGDDTETAEGSDGEPREDDEALSAAQAAAQAAAEFEGENVAEIDSGENGETDAETTGETAAPAGATIAGAEVEETTDEETRVLEFRLGEERYCLDIEYVEEIVREETVTRVPNTPEYVEGVVDLRGQITTILDPKIAADIEAENGDRLIVVFDSETFEDYGEIGWSVDAVDQVSLIAEADVKEPPMDESYINGVIERGEDFVIWTTPDLALDVTEEE
ncbi:Chemotaxis protein [Halorhabdus tiamatea SARL4B]|uniref:Chemotaxis protein n=1 Tax=Halorhabdus tiamatea SARL4B TaxID=1033806 RepID=F7PP84_9EURY|nr:chemotaxis protein CheW [Halorhabdus tiamatea]ERJ07121.1 Chemotaxis protein [Halorhabdus tiamatea SARL4B]CCQ32742.1 chemotaxis signal transduction protein CheW [Halorhabdus tiamatea SARL4B]